MEQLLPSSFIKDYGTLIIAVVALIQPWCVYFYKLFFRRARVELHTSAIVEVGYGNFGPTLGLYGTLVSLHQNCFIENISVLLRRESDRAEHRFNWFVFRSNQFRFGPNSELTFELPSGFIVNPAQPHRYNIMFSDNQRFSEMQTFNQEIQRLWSEEVRQSSSPPNPPNHFELFRQFVSGARGTGPADFHSNISRLCYWEVGNYSMEVTIRTSSIRRQFVFNRTFSLTQNNVNGLRLNAVAILAQLCNQPNVIFNFAYPTIN